MSRFLYVLRRGGTKTLDFTVQNKSLFDIVEFESIGRWREKRRFQKKKSFIIFYINYSR